jgi:hypothetical protein
VLGIAAAITASEGSNLLAGGIFMLVGAAIIIGRQTLWPPDPNQVGWASWSVQNRANWRQWPKPWFEAGSILIGGLLFLGGLSAAIDSLW